MHVIFWALLILFLAGAFFRMNWVYYLVYVVGGVWVFSHFWVRRTLHKLELTRTMAHRAFNGEHIDVQTVFTNRSWLPMPWLQVQEAVPLDLKDQPDYRLVASLGGHSRLEYNYGLQCKRRGYFTVGPMSLRTSDLFGFVTARWEESSATQLIVYPQVVPLARLGLPSRSPFGDLASRQQLLEDPARLAGVRAYAAGDNLRRVHWKASAHADALLVKKLQPSQAVPVTIVLDMNRAAYPTRALVGSSEWAVTVAASIANVLINERQAVGLDTNGFDPLTGAPTVALPQRTGQEQLIALLSLLARVQIHDAGRDLAAWLPDRFAGLPWGATLIVVTPAVDEAALWTLHNLYRRGNKVIVLLCARQPDVRILAAKAERLGIHVHNTVWEIDLEAFAGVF
ncbi:MAG: DUF58 domain-containing protein [Anaerolineales bacterium]|nr:DUF58 domain-containing protein [Anaerolineales bacterium]